MKKLMYLFSCMIVALLFTAAASPKQAMALVGPLNQVILNITDEDEDAGVGNIFKGATGLVVDGNNNIYVSDFGNNRVIKFNAGRAQADVFKTKNDIVLKFPSGMAIDGNYLYVANTGKNQIVIINLADPNAAWGTLTGLEGKGEKAFNQPMGVAIRGNVLHVADTYNHRIVEYNRDTQAASWEYSGAVGGTGSGDGGRGDDTSPSLQFNQPNTIAYDSAGNVYVSDAFNYRILKLDDDLNFIEAYGGFSQNACFGIALDSRNNIYVADRQDASIKNLSASPQVSPEKASPVEVAGNGDGTFPVSVYINNNVMWTVDVKEGGVIKRASITFGSNNDTGGGGGGGGAPPSEEEDEIVNPTPEAIPTTRLGGYDRFGTAIEISNQGWADGADTVVLAYAYSFPDALAAAPLAAKHGAPILLSDLDAVTPVTLTEIERLNPTNIILVGGTAVLSQNLENALVANYNVSRYYGYTRYETAAKIAEALGSTKGEAIIVNGNFFPDALTVSPYAAYEQVPILFNDTDNLPEVTKQALENGNVSRTIVVGGTVVVNESIYSQLPGPTRYAGYTHYDTAVEVANGLGMNCDNVFVATGINFPDALVMGPLAGKNKNPLIMVDSQLDTLPASAEAFFRNKKSSIERLTIIGGTAVVKPIHVTAIGNILNN